MENRYPIASVTSPRVALVRRPNEVRSKAGRFGRKLGIAMLAGTLIGLAASALQSKADASHSVPVVSVEAHSAGDVTHAAELQRLKIRNRRLETLVTVLRERTRRGAP